MFTDYLHEVKDNAFKGVFTLTKRSFVYQIAAYILFMILFLLIALAFAGSFFLDYMTIAQNPENVQAMGENMRGLFMENAGMLFFLIFITFLLTSWLTTFALSINDNIITNNSANLGLALKKSVSKRMLNMILYSLLFFLIYIVGAVIVSALLGLFLQINMVLGWLFFIVGMIVLGVFLLRLSAGPAFVVHGEANASAALTSSLRTITWTKALIFIVIGIGAGLILYVFTLLITLTIGSSANLIVDIASGNGLSFMGVLAQLFGLLINGLFYAFIYAGISSLFFRYSDTVNLDSLEDHLVEDL